MTRVVVRREVTLRVHCLVPAEDRIVCFDVRKYPLGKWLFSFLFPGDESIASLTSVRRVRGANTVE